MILLLSQASSSCDGTVKIWKLEDQVCKSLIYTGTQAELVYLGNCTNASAVKDLHYEGRLNILSKFHEPLG